MRDPSPQPAPPPGPNPALWVVAGVLAFTVVASFLLLYVALQGREPELPAHYRWEGPGLDADLERADAARRAGARVTLDFSTGDVLRVHVSFADRSQLPPDGLELRLTHATLPALDRSLRLTRDSTPDGYVARVAPLAPGRWLVQVGDDAHWQLRGRLEAPTRAPVELGQ